MRYYFPRIWPEEKARGKSKLSVKLDLKTRWENILARTGY
jgi:hypothetical protein